MLEWCIDFGSCGAAFFDIGFDRTFLLGCTSEGGLFVDSGSFDSDNNSFFHSVGNGGAFSRSKSGKDTSFSCGDDRAVLLDRASILSAAVALQILAAESIAGLDRFFKTDEDLALLVPFMH